MKTSRKLKGFTLIELIIVIAIFLMLMIVALAVLDPVNNLYKSTFEYADSASVVDNVSMYIEDNIRYSNRIDISHNVGFTDPDAEKVFINRKVGEFTNRFHLNSPNKISQVVKNEKVYVMRINNPDIAAANLDAEVLDKSYMKSGSSAPGQITVWQYDPSKVAIKDWDKVTDSEAASAEDVSAFKLWAVNEQFYKDYSFTFNFGAFDDETGKFEVSGTRFCMNFNMFRNTKEKGEYKELTNTHLKNTLAFSLENVATTSGAREEDIYKKVTFTDPTDGLTKEKPELWESVFRYWYRDYSVNTDASVPAGNDVYIVYTECPEVEKQH